MKRDILNVIALAGSVLVLAVGGPLFARQIGTLSHAKLAARAGERIVTLEVSGMTCTGCARRMESDLARVPGVSAAQVRFPERRAYVVCNSVLPDSALVAAVRGSGPGFTALVEAR